MPLAVALLTPSSCLVLPSPAGLEQLPPGFATLDPALALQQDPHLAPVYAPRRPKETLLHKVVSEHLDEFLEQAAEHYARPLPRYVVDALRGYLACGDFERGFARCRCEACGYDILVPFTCAKRTTCPSCSSRRMCNTAAFWTDRVLPNTALRQWVLAIPYELRPLAAAKPAVATALGRIFVESVFEHYERLAEIPGTKCAAVLSLHRAGDSLNLNPHNHGLMPDGVLYRDERAPSPDGTPGPVRFAQAPPPSQAELERIITRIRDRSVRWLGRHGYVDERDYEQRSTELPEQSALEGCLAIAMSGSHLARLTDDAAASSDDDASATLPGYRPSRPFTTQLDGFNLNAAVVIEAGDDEGRERLCRYCLRPAFALSRLSELSDGRIAYQLRYPIRGATHRVMEPVEFLARVAALVAPPRHPLTRYYGALSSRSSWRQDVVPRPPPPPRKRRSTSSTASHAACTSRADQSKATATAEPADGEGPSTTIDSAPTQSANASAPPPATPPAATNTTVPPSLAAPFLSSRPTEVELSYDHELNVITARHLDRLLDGELLATGPRLNWSKLLRRTFGLDLTQCPRCSGRMKPIAVITDPAVIRRILDHLHDKAARLEWAPRRAAARDPPPN